MITTSTGTYCFGQNHCKKLYEAGYALALGRSRLKEHDNEGLRSTSSIVSSYIRNL